MGRSIPLAYAPLCSYRFVHVTTWMFYAYVYECTYTSYAYSIGTWSDHSVHAHSITHRGAMQLVLKILMKMLSSIIHVFMSLLHSPCNSMNSEMLCKLYFVAILLRTDKLSEKFQCGSIAAFDRCHMLDLQ